MKKKTHIKIYDSILQVEDLDLYEAMVLSTIVSYAATSKNYSTTISNSGIITRLKSKMKNTKVRTSIKKFTEAGYINRTTVKTYYEDSAKWRNKRVITLTEKTLALLLPEETKSASVPAPKPKVKQPVQPVVKPSEIKAEATPVAPEPQEETINTKDALHFLYNDYDYEKLQNLFCSKWNPMLPPEITRTKLIDLLNNRHFLNLKAALRYPFKYASEYKEITQKLLDWDGTIPEPKQEEEVVAPDVKIIKLEPQASPEPEAGPISENEKWYQELMAMD